MHIKSIAYSFTKCETLHLCWMSSTLKYALAAERRWYSNRWHSLCLRSGSWSDEALQETWQWELEATMITSCIATINSSHYSILFYHKQQNQVVLWILTSKFLYIYLGKQLQMGFDHLHPIWNLFLHLVYLYPVFTEGSIYGSTRNKMDHSNAKQVP